jgi:hypothetical protein
MHVFNRPSGNIASSLRCTSSTKPSWVDSVPPRAPFPRLVDVGNDSVRDVLDVPVPVLAVLPLALLFVAALAMYEEHSKVHHEEVGEDHAPTLGLARHDVLAVAVLEKVRIFLGCGERVLGGILNEVAGERGGQNVGPAHEPIAEVVDVTCHAPPSRDEKTRTSLGLDVLEVRDAGVLRVGAEAVLFVVHGAEDVVAETLDGENGNNALDAEVDGVHRKVTRLDGVCEGHPYEITERQHHTEAVLDDVHGGQNGGFHEQRIERVHCLGNGNQDDGVSDTAKVAVLLHDEGNIDDDPAEHARAQLAPRLDVDYAEDGERDARVEFAANEPVVQHVAGAATSSKFPVVGVAGVLDAEGADIAESSEEVGDQNVGGNDANKVVGNKSPDRELGTVGNGSSGKEGEDEQRRVPG